MSILPHGKKSSKMFIFIGIVAISLSSGCATVQKHWPSNAKMKKSAIKALRHPGTWVPAAGAAAIAIGDWDRDISDWAREKTPVFGSTESAEEKSDQFRSFALYGMYLSAIAVHNDSESYWLPMIQRLAWEHVGVFTAKSVHDQIEKVVDRDRPDGDKEGFPSGHSTRAFAYTGMTYRNIEDLNLPPFWEYSAKSVETCFGYSTAWARVEAGRHYPTDVLAGAALGNFISLFIYDAFFEKDSNVHVMFNAKGGIVISFKHSF